MSTRPARTERRAWLLAAVALVAVLVLAGCAAAGTDGTSARTGPDREARAEPDPAPAGRTKPRPERSPKPRPRLYLVTRVVDGDTVDLGNGETVRLVGIDAPEVGECGYEQARANLARLVLGRAVRLGESDEDRDRYGRLLRYVDVGRQDAGLRLIKNGQAIARYDSRDGYGRHPRERLYVAADRAASRFTCVPAPQPFAGQPGPAPGAGCAHGYDPCVPPYPPDVDCADVNGPIHVTGSDPHGLDADGDGVACEWG